MGSDHLHALRTHGTALRQCFGPLRHVVRRARLLTRNAVIAAHHLGVPGRAFEVIATELGELTTLVRELFDQLEERYVTTMSTLTRSALLEARISAHARALALQRPDDRMLAALHREPWLSVQMPDHGGDEPLSHALGACRSQLDTTVLLLADITRSLDSDVRHTLASISRQLGSLTVQADAEAARIGSDEITSASADLRHLDRELNAALTDIAASVRVLAALAAGALAAGALAADDQRNDHWRRAA